MQKMPNETNMCQRHRNLQQKTFFPAEGFDSVSFSAICMEFFDHDGGTWELTPCMLDSFLGTADDEHKSGMLYL